MWVRMSCFHAPAAYACLATCQHRSLELPLPVIFCVREQSIMLTAKSYLKNSAASCSLTCVWLHDGAKYLCAFGKVRRETAEPQEVLAIRDVRFVVPVESKLNKSKKSVLRWTQARTSTLIRSGLIIIVHTAPYHNQSSGHSYLSSTTHYTSQSVRSFRQFVGALSLSGNVSMCSSCPRQPFYPSGTL